MTGFFLMLGIMDKLDDWFLFNPEAANAFHYLGTK
jgi:hypothetical protein